MKTHTKTNGKIHEALELLNEAAQEKREEVYGIVGNKYRYIKGVFENAAQDGRQTAKQAKGRIVKGMHFEEKKIKDMAGRLDKKVRKDPWVFLSSVALGSLIVGLMLGRKA